ncbi:hypothetical protein [Acinetobacter sp. MD2(2019)]|uniref:hypothetical protein n=1 Tax=Acinetobacter sp. MD2(2019) TaxID=2605273 RepID=UPI002D1E9ED9|nr:hypothetical protein [Acinetobacter sp. MD2(2019)]MEB3753608.1 hypothetical protein [Acinetobacter sp. MD2(2019)]
MTASMLGEPFCRVEHAAKLHKTNVFDAQFAQFQASPLDVFPWIKDNRTMQNKLQQLDALEWIKCTWLKQEETQHVC